MFKQFDINYDSVTIDNTLIEKPSYLSPSQWTSFWEIFDGELVARKVTDSFNKGYDVRGEEQDKEIEEVKDFCFSIFNYLKKDINLLIENTEMSSYEKLIHLRKYIESKEGEICQL